MRYVLDVSVATCWVLPRPLSAKALQLRADYQNAIHELIAPAHFCHEAASALTKAERQRLIPVRDADPLLCDILATPPALQTVDPIKSWSKSRSSQFIDERGSMAERRLS
jgi:hypothetical protein